MKYDLVIVGGGTAGCAAAFNAGVLGLKTLIIEKNIHLGGSITSGLVVPVMKSCENQINTKFFNELVNELQKLGGQVEYQGNKGWFNPELSKIALDNLMEKANVDVLFNTYIKDIIIVNNVIKSIIINKTILSSYNDKLQINNKELLERIDTRYIIDATGDCEVGTISGCEFLDNVKETQPFSLRFTMGGVNLEVFSKWILELDKDINVTTVENIDGKIHLSTAYTWDSNKNWALRPLFEDAIKKNILKDSDTNYFQIFTVAGMPDTIAFNCPRIVDISGNINIKNTTDALKLARQSILRLSNFCKIYLKGFENAYISNIADMLGIRVSRRIKGKYIYTIEDLRTGKKFANPVLISNYPVDVHSREKDNSTLQKVNEYMLPIESLMSANIDNLFVAGRCLSADYMSQGALRVQASCFSMGEGIAKYIATL